MTGEVPLADARSDPLIGGPPPPQGCKSLNARQWASIDPGNGVPWLLIYTQANLDGDASAKTDAMAHLAAATRFDDRPDIAAAAVVSRRRSCCARRKSAKSRPGRNR